MKILILYGTNSGGTQFVAEIVGSVFEKGHHTVVIENVPNANPQDMESYDLVCLGSCTWDYDELQGQLQQDFRKFAEKLQGMEFPAKKFAVFALGDSSYTYFAGAADRLEELVSNIKGVQIGDSLRIDGFYINQEQNSQLAEVWAQQILDRLPRQ